ncbi:MAG: choice-of-anchor D domain-containing protein, partial [Terriglobia bacterium]
MHPKRIVLLTLFTLCSSLASRPQTVPEPVEAGLSRHDGQQVPTAEQAQSSRSVRPPADRVTKEVDDGQRVILTGNTRPEAKAINDRGRVSDDLMLDHMMLQLQRTPEQEQALQQFIKDIHDPASPLFHHWIKAAEFGQRYGVAPADVVRVTDWLESQGFTVNLVYPSQMVIDFTGSAGQIRQAFRTEIHHLLVNGHAHVANMSDPQIPAALASTVAGVVSLNDFRPHPMFKRRANYTVGSSEYAIVPADLATIYNLNPAVAAGVSGQGQTIVLIEDTDVYSTADWSTFRSTFGLATAYPLGSLAQVHPPSSPTNNCTDPGYNGDDVEAALDVEWASAGAPSAAIELAACSDTYTNFGGFIALQNLLNAAGTPPAIVSISYGESESYLGASFNASINSLYQQAVTEGVSVFVSSGDEGAASSDADEAYAVSGITVSGFTSTAYNVSVGGTDFADTYEVAASTYWSSANTANYGSASSYVPEIPWNDSCASVLIGDYFRTLPTFGAGGYCDKGNNITTGSGSGGPSGCATGTPDTAGVVSGTCSGYPKPSWQSGLIGNPSDGVRDIPDVSLFSANGFWGHYYVFCFSDPGWGYSCAGTPNTWAGAGGTSFAAPIMAAIQSLINQATGSRWGNPNPSYYSLAATEYGSGGNASCNSALGRTVATNCIFYDVTQIPLLNAGSGTGGDINVPCLGVNCYLPSGSYGVLSSAPQALSSALVTSLGSGYTSAPSCTLSGGSGTGAACSANITGVVSSVGLMNGGSGYTTYPISCSLTGGGGTGASCEVYICTNNQACYLSLSSFGSGYTSAPTCTISGGGGQGATCSATEVPGITVSLTAAGSGYTTIPQCVLSGGGGTGGTCAALAVNTSDDYQPAFGATTGWDFATGIGTVNAANLVAGFLTLTGVLLSPTTIAFGAQGVGTTSSAQTVTLTNTGSAALSITSIGFTGRNPGQFAQNNTCGLSLNAGASCTVSITFTPTAALARVASLSVADSALGSPQIVSLSGTGVNGPAVRVSPAAIAFGSQSVGTTSSAQTVTLSNSGNATLTIASIGLTGANPRQFAQNNTCGASLSVGASCTISVTFAPTVAFSPSASLTVTGNASNSPQSVSLTGTGTGPTASLSPTSIAFGNQAVSTTSSAQTVTLTNKGNLTLTITSIGFTGRNPGQFAQNNTCGSLSLSAGASCTISVTFTPTAALARSASLSVADNAPGSPHSVSLTGTGVGQPAVNLNPASVAFGNQPVGTTSPAQTVTLSNPGNATLSITSIGFTGPNPRQFAQNNTCGATLSAAAQCTISLTFTPTVAFSPSANLTVTDNTSGSPHNVSLTGTGTGPTASLSPTSIAFGNQSVGTTSSAQTVTLTNKGNLTLSITSIGFTGKNPHQFAQNNSCGATLSAGANCTISVTYSPTAAFSASASLTVTDSAPGSPHSVSLTG